MESPSSPRLLLPSFFGSCVDDPAVQGTTTVGDGLRWLSSDPVIQVGGELRHVRTLIILVCLSSKQTRRTSVQMKNLAQLGTKRRSPTHLWSCLIIPPTHKPCARLHRRAVATLVLCPTQILPSAPRHINPKEERCTHWNAHIRLEMVPVASPRLDTRKRARSRRCAMARVRRPRR